MDQPLNMPLPDLADSRPVPCGACVVCAGLQGSEQRYVASVLNRRTTPERVAESLTGSLGFCGQHTAALRHVLEDSARFRAAAGMAAGWLARMVADTRVYGERLNDILFRSRDACPACLHRRRLEGRLLARVLRGAPTSKRALANYLDGQLCLNHLHAMTPHLLSAGLPPVAGQAFKRAADRLRRQYPLWDMDGCAPLPAPPAALATQRMALAASIGLSCHVPQASLARLRQEAPVCACVVCDAVLAARDQWRTRLARTIELGYPLRLAAPSCPCHVVGCLLDESAAAGHAAWSRFLQPDNRPAKAHGGSEAAPAPPPRQRKGASWHLERPDAADREGRPDHYLAALGASCPACGADDVARMRAVLRYIAEYRSPADGDPPLCMKHFAEAYILESRGTLRQGLAQRRMAALQAQAEHWPVRAFGRFS
ncbi:hypothetical protein [Achromobacter aloeverae]